MATTAAVALVVAAGFAGTCTVVSVARLPQSPAMPPPPRPATSTTSPQPLPSVKVVADEDGFFRVASADAAGGAVGDVWTASGVLAIEGRFGRLDQGAAEHAIFVRAADGTIERRALRVASASPILHPRQRFLEAVKAAAEVRSVAGAAPLLDRILLAPETGDAFVPPPPRPDVWPEGDVRSPPPPGADLAAWAPSQFPFVRFRTVEAALRFCDLADRIGARVLAASGDGRDDGTLRWALHDLVLPEVWNANPESEKGVGECGLVVAGLGGDASSPGRPEIALLLRVTDPELHAMETASGLGYAAMPEHAWKAAADPEPATRARRNFRRTVGDVEVVATSARLLDLVTRPRARPPLAEGPAWRTARGAAPVVPEEAFLLVVPAEARHGAACDADAPPSAVLRGVREARGLASLWKRWTGLDPSQAFGRSWEGPAHAFPASLAGLLSVRCTTSAKAADVAAEFDSERAAEAARAALEPAAAPFAAGTSACRANRRDLVLLARVEPEAKSLAERAFVVLGFRPVCPSGGTYVVHPITREVSCSLHGSDARPLADPPASKPLLRDLRREGAVVRFSVPDDRR